jgi:hypothetical protein
MSGYQVTNPNWFAVQAQSNLVNAQIAFLQNTFWQPQEVSYTTGTIPTADLLAGYVFMTGFSTGTFVATTESAADIIAAIQLRLKSIAGTQSIPLPPALRDTYSAVTVGFNFPVIFNPDYASGTVTLAGGSGVTVQGTATMNAGAIGIYQLVVTSLTTIQLVRLN